MFSISTTTSTFLYYFIVFYRFLGFFIGNIVGTGLRLILMIEVGTRLGLSLEI